MEEVILFLRERCSKAVEGSSEMQLLNCLNLEGEILELRPNNIFDQIEVEENNLLYENNRIF